ncbi:hypothetical protein ABPG75_012030 [Micractinium tetrahymenae]
MARSRVRLSTGEERGREQVAAKPLAARNRGEASAPKHRQATHKEGAPSQKQAGAAPAPPSRRSPPSPPPLPAAAEALLLPGLDEDGPPEGGPCQLPLAQDKSQASSFGNPFAAADSLRVTSISRSAAARRTSQLRLVVQADPAEGRRLSRMPPQERPVARVRTLPLQRRSKGRRADSSDAGGSAAAATGAQPPAPLTAAASAASLAEQASSSSTSSSQALAQDDTGSSVRAAGSDAPAEAASGGSEVPLPLLLPLPLRPGAASSPACGGADGAVQAQAEAGQAQAQPAHEDVAGPPEAVATAAASDGDVLVAASSASEGGSQRAAAASVYSGVPAEVEAEAMPSTPAPPAWLQQQGSCQNEPGLHVVEQGPAGPALHNHHAAANWRCMWLSGLQWHNASRAGQPIRAGSPWAFVPLDPNEPLLELFMFQTAVMPEHVIAGAARFEDIMLGDPQLHSAAVEAGVFSWGAWAVPAPGGGYTLVEGGRAMALPVSLRCAPPPTVALFLACVWHEANRAESLAHATYTFTAGGERVADERSLKWPLAELRHWVRLAVGGSKRQAEELLAMLAHISCFGIE